MKIGFKCIRLNSTDCIHYFSICLSHYFVLHRTLTCHWFASTAVSALRWVRWACTWRCMRSGWVYKYTLLLIISTTADVIILRCLVLLPWKDPLLWWKQIAALKQGVEFQHHPVDNRIITTKGTLWQLSTTKSPWSPLIRAQALWDHS